MKRQKLLLTGLCLFLFFIVLCAGCNGVPEELNEDDSIMVLQTNGDYISLPSVPNRIIILNAHAAEVVSLLGAGDKVVGIASTVAEHPELSTLFPDAVNVGQGTLPNIEMISELKPDVIVAYNSLKPKNAHLIENMEIPIIYIDCYRPELMAQDVKSLGILTGKSVEADEYVAYYSYIMASVLERTGNISDWPIVYCERDSSYTGMGIGSGIDSLLDISGGINVMNASMGERATLSPEWIVASDPDVIIKTLDADSMNNASYEYEDFVSRTGFASMRAVKENRTWILYNHISYGPRSFVGAVAVAKMLHPSEFSDMSVKELLQDYNDKYGFNWSVKNSYYPEFFVNC